MGRRAVRARLVRGEFRRHDAAVDKLSVQVHAAPRPASGGPSALRDSLLHGPASRHRDRLPAHVPGRGQPAALSAHHLRGVPRLVVRRQLQRRAPARPRLSASWEDDMDVRDLFLDQHAAMHSVAVGGNKMSAAERAFTGPTDEQMRVRPREDLNSLAWLMWHIARAEDIFVNAVLAARPQTFEDGWAKRLAITRRDFGIGMTSAEVTELTRQIELGALREYRDACAGGFKPQDWEGTVSADAVQRAASQGAFGVRTEQIVKGFPGRPRAAMLSGIALFHSAGHLGEAATVRTAGGFGTGV